MPFRLNIALLILRLAGAPPFLYHGSAILLGAFGGPGPERFAASQHMAPIVGYLVGLAQVGGGLALLLGVFTRIGAVCIMCVMAGAIKLVHWAHGFDIGQGGYEFALTQMLVSLALLFTGPGKYAVSRLLPGWMREL